MSAGRFDEAASASINAGTSATLISFYVPGNLRAVITGFANYVGQTAALGNITWRLRINGINRPPLDATRDILGDQAQPWPVEDDRMNANGGALVEVIAENDGGVAYDVGARLVGRLER